MSFLPQELIRKKRDGAALSAAEIEFLVGGITSGDLGEGQVAAFAMAVFFRGMDMDERIALTRSMAASGRRIDWRRAGLDRPAVDKHSTGGGGDKVRPILAPPVASSGGAAPMISGRAPCPTRGAPAKPPTISAHRQP